MTRFIFYRRCSTKEQKLSGLGLDSQTYIVERYVEGLNVGLKPDDPKYSRIIDIVEEVETRKSVKRRPKLLAALDDCAVKNAHLLIANLTRLAGNVAFTSAIMESSIPFVCAQYPQADRLTLHILASVSEAEVRTIGERTKLGLAEKKKRDPEHPLGAARKHLISQKTGLPIKPAVKISPELGIRGRKASVAERKRKRDAFYLPRIVPAIKRFSSEGKGASEIAKLLNELDYVSRTKKPWNRYILHRVCKYYSIKLNNPGQFHNNKAG